MKLHVATWSALSALILGLLCGCGAMPQSRERSLDTSRGARLPQNAAPLTLGTVVVLGTGDDSAIARETSLIAATVIERRYAPRPAGSTARKTPPSTPGPSVDAAAEGFESPAKDSPDIPENDENSAEAPVLPQAAAETVTVGEPMAERSAPTPPGRPAEREHYGNPVVDIHLVERRFLVGWQHQYSLTAAFVLRDGDLSLYRVVLTIESPQSCAGAARLSELLEKGLGEVFWHVQY